MKLIFTDNILYKYNLIENKQEQQMLVSLMVVHCLSSVVCSLGLPFMFFYEKNCSCGLMVSYVENMIHDQMVRGLMEPIIQKKVLSQVVEGDSLKKTMAYIDTLEKAK